MQTSTHTSNGHALAAALGYAAHGWPPVPVTGKRPSCGDAWQLQATSDPAQVELLFRHNDHDGVGVVLGESAGIIDVECDNDQAEQTLLELFAGTIPTTPTFQSTRGKHRLFNWTDDLPEPTKAVFKIGQLEFRTGNGDKAAQTVFPPSNGRTWIVSPDDAAVAVISAEVIDRIKMKYAAKKQKRDKPTTRGEPRQVDSLDVPKWLLSRGAKLLETDTTPDGAARWFIECPGIASHTNENGVRDCCVTQEPSGRLGGVCFHQSCGMVSWQAISSSIGKPTRADYQPARTNNHQPSEADDIPPWVGSDDPDDDTAKTPQKINAKYLDAMPEALRMIEEICVVKEAGDEVLRLHYFHDVAWWHNGTHYREESNSDIDAKTVQHLDCNYYRLTKAAVANLQLCLKAKTNVSSHREMPTWLDGTTGGNWIAMKNGILNIAALLRNETEVLVPHTPRYFSANVLPFNFDPMAECPKWLAFLARNLEADQERIALLQEFFGYCLSPCLTAHKFLFHEGQGANGKSVACAVLTAMLGTANVSSVPLEAFGERFGLYQTLGKMANIASEIGEIDRVAEGILKAFTSGDAMQFDRKHRDPITARPTAKLVFASNNRPRFSDKSGGLWRRMILMPWRVVIPEAERVRGMDTPQWWQDQGELPGILLWAIAGLWQLEKQGGFIKSEVCEAALSEYRAESNPARLFLEEHFRFDSESWVVCEDVYRPYVEWTKSNGFLPLASSSFGHEVRRAFPKVERRKKLIGSDRSQCYFGLADRR